MSLIHLLIVLILVVVLIGALPGTPWMAGRNLNYGYAPSGIVGVILVLVLLLWLLGRI